MSKYSERHEITVVGIDLGKTWLQVCGQDALGRERLSKKCRPQQLKELMATLPHSLVGLEASARAHYWARLLAGYGHEVKLIAPQFVKPFVKSNKSDRADAEAICEAVQRPSMRFVGVKTAAQQDQQSLHRVRSLAVGQRTAQVNQVAVVGGIRTGDRVRPASGADGATGDTGRGRERLEWGIPGVITGYV